VLKDDPATGSYTASNTGPNTRITRADIATALVDQLDTTTHNRAAISVTN
jgi:putative NADH-flavin reductase